MFKSLKIRSYVLAVQGAIVLVLGLMFLYVRANMTDAVFDVVDIGAAILLTVVALVIAALADWIAAIGEGVEHFRRFAFYMLCGFGLLLGGALVVYSHYRTLALLLFFAAAHALVHGMSVFSFQWGHLHRSHHRGLVYAAGVISLLFAVAMGALATSNDDRLATALLGAYLCFIAVRMLHHAWRLHEVFRQHGDGAVVEG